MKISILGVKRLRINQFVKRFIAVFMGVTLLLTSAVGAWEGDNGYESGISSGAVAGKTSLEYQEVSFITGEPILLKGTLTIKKSLKNDVVNATYTYALKNADKNATLTRVLVFNTKKTLKPNGQTVEETSFSKAPTETLKIGNVTYALKSYDFTRTNLVDPRPGIHYYAGNTWGKKVYQVAGTNGGTITLETTGSFYGYDGYWGSSQVELFDHMIQSELKVRGRVDSWGGTAHVALSSTSTQKLDYVENRPEQISFEGGYIQTQNNSSILEYSCQLPEFDATGVSTDYMKEIRDSLQIETFPVQIRLPVPNLKHLKGHWAEEDIKELYSLEVFKGDEASFNPEQYITRAQFIQAMVEAAKAVPVDPSLVSKTTSTVAARKATKPVVVSPFRDVSTESIYFAPIDEAYKRGLISGGVNEYFRPADTITLADALVIFVRALGLESLAPGPNAVTSFRDNDKIPSYARNAAFVAEKIGLIQGDARGNLNPLEKLTKGRAAALLNGFINYMREGIRKDYRERIMNYQ